MPDRRAVAALMTTVVVWAAAFPAIRAAVPDLGPVVLAIARMLVAAVAFVGVAIVARVRRPARRDLPLIALCGLTGMSGYHLLLNAGEQTVSAGTAGLLVATAPLFSVVIAAAALRERVTARRWIGFALGLLGAAVIALSQQRVEVKTGALLVLGGAALFSVYHVAQKPLLRRYSALEVASYATWAALLELVPFVPFAAVQSPRFGAEAVIATLWLGVASSAIGATTWAYAGARLEVSQLTAALYLVPAVAVIVGWVWLGEIPTLADLVGGALAIAGVAIAVQPQKAVPAVSPAVTADGRPAD